VHFHLGTTVTSIEAQRVVLKDGSTLDAELVVVGIGVKPRVDLAQAAGLKIERGVAVNTFLETSAPGVFAAGDIARYPDRRSGQAIRIEHWVVAERQGQIAARNMLGKREACDLVPFFWTRHYDVSIDYVGHADRWDRITLDGDLAKHDCTATYWQSDKVLAVVTVGRNSESLRAEASMERRA
jgi:NADPH-dependent 2,4-dienoyl-CoA reductase/sulfur reductase-like enzyme